MKVTETDFVNALKEIEPSAMREVQVEVPDVAWKDVGGLQEVKRQLFEAVELPLRDPDSLKRLGISPPRGILLYGPPGTGKTLVAKALANESKANFIAIKGPEIMSKWVGESEKAVRLIFKKAKQVAPSIIFLDELDAIAPQRGMGYDSGASERVVDQILTSLDGLESLGSVTVIAATNRPDIVDKALMRPGRFDKIVLVPVPDREMRLEILKVHTSRMPLKGVDIEDLAERTDGFVGADIEALCKEAALNALRMDADAKDVKMSDFEKAITVVYPSTNEETMRFYERFRQDLRSALVRKGESAGFGYYR
jgi:transitional endoplasmic reticulum ATPase